MNVCMRVCVRARGARVRAPCRYMRVCVSVHAKRVGHREKGYFSNQCVFVYGKEKVQVFIVALHMQNTHPCTHTHTHTCALALANILHAL